MNFIGSSNLDELIPSGSRFAIWWPRIYFECIYEYADFVSVSSFRVCCGIVFDVFFLDCTDNLRSQLWESAISILCVRRCFYIFCSGRNHLIAVIATDRSEPNAYVCVFVSTRAYMCNQFCEGVAFFSYIYLWFDCFFFVWNGKEKEKREKNNTNFIIKFIFVGFRRIKFSISIRNSGINFLVDISEGVNSLYDE